MNQPTQHAITIFNAAVASVQPQQLLPQYLSVTNSNLTICRQTFPLQNIRHLKLIAAGKAASAMALEAEKILGSRITHGLCITKRDHALPLQFCNTIEAGHPVPDEESLRAGREVLQLLGDNSENDLVLFLISGGASALLADVPPGATLPELQQVFSSLVNSGASIAQINTARKHLSSIKGGGLARAAYPAKLFSLLLSDVPGDDPDVIASGPTVPNTTTFADAVQVVQQYGLWESLPPSLHQHLSKGLQGTITDTPKKGDAIFNNTFTQVIGSNRIALQAAAATAKDLGYHVILHEELTTGHTEAVAKQLVNDYQNYSGPLPACVLLGGETTLQVSGGYGGRNQHLALTALQAMLENASQSNISLTLLAAGTDGTDGPTDATGAVVSKEAFAQLPGIKQKLEDAMQGFNSYPFFNQHGGHVVTGPTQTNVMDVLVVLIGPTDVG